MFFVVIMELSGVECSTSASTDEVVDTHSDRSFVTRVKMMF